METTQNRPRTNVEYEAEIIKLQTRNTELESLVRYYEEQFRLAKHRQYGAKSEKSEYEDGFVQQDLFNEVEATADQPPEATEAPSEPELRKVQKHYRNRKRLVNDTLPENITIEVVEHGLDETDCPQCGEEMHVMGRDEKRRELVIVLATVKIREHVSKTYACRTCEQKALEPGDATIINTPFPAPVIKGSYASAEAIVHSMYQKFMIGYAQKVNMLS
jgi:transposase